MWRHGCGSHRAGERNYYRRRRERSAAVFIGNGRWHVDEASTSQATWQPARGCQHLLATSACAGSVKIGASLARRPSRRDIGAGRGDAISVKNSARAGRHSSSYPRPVNSRHAAAGVGLDDIAVKPAAI